MRGKRWAWLLVAAAALAAAYLLLSPRASSTRFPDYRDAHLVARGEGLYHANCAQCHGPAARGEDPNQPMGGQKADGTYLAPALDGTGHAWHHPPDALFQIIKDGSPAADSPMRGWKGRLSDEEIGAVMAYFRALWPEKIQTRYSSAFEGSDP